MTLRVRFGCWYFPTGCKEDDQWRVFKVTRYLKGDKFNGYVYTAYGQAFDDTAGKRLLHRELVEGLRPELPPIAPRATVVFIPGHADTSFDAALDSPFARVVRDALPARWGEEDLLRWREHREPSHARGGARDPQPRYDNLIVRDDLEGITGPVFLVDDIMTSGATLRAAACRLGERGCTVAGAICFARTRDEMFPDDKMMPRIADHWHTCELDEFKPRRRLFGRGRR